MTSLRSWIAFLTAVVSIAFASGVSAGTGPTKQWSIAVAPTVIGTQNQAITITVKNETPNGNSTINSLHINLPAGYTLDTTDHSGAVGSGNAVVRTSWLGTLSATSNVISFSNMSPLKPQVQFTITAYVNVGASVAACSPSQWTGDAWTGSSFTGSAFTQLASTAYAGATNVTQVANDGVLAFTRAPSNVGVPAGTTTATVSGTVSAKGCNTSVAGLPIKITVTDPSGANTITTTTVTTGSDGTAPFSIALPIGHYLITASATGFTSVAAPVTVFAGLLNCEPTMPFSFGDDPNGDITQEGYASGERGYWNKDGVSCIPLLYTFTNTILTDNTVHLEWDTSTGQHPAFTYIMTWKTEDVDHSTNATNFGWPVPKRVFVAWTIDSGTQLPNFVPALACISPNLPAPYAQLTSDIGTATAGTSQNISVTIPPAVPTGFPTATVPSTTPFAIDIGTERMLVTAVSGSTWTVTRGDGGTSPAAHLANGYVMSTPLPLDITGTQVPMCVQSHAWQSVGYDPVTGVAQIRYTTRVFDIGDGYVGLR